MVLVPVKNRWPSSPIRTDQVWPALFESTWNSTSILPSSDFALSFQVADELSQPPERMTSRPLASALVAPAATTASATTPAAVTRNPFFVMMLLMSSSKACPPLPAA